jgi:Mrp family chromosome partitioning ATPase/capsular polysaccharide biosynthesis protein
MPSAQLIRRGALIIIASVILTTAVALLFSMAIGQAYTSAAQLVVTPVAEDDPTFAGLSVIQQSSDPTRDVSTLTAYAETQDVHDEAGKLLAAAGFTPAQIEDAAAKLSIEPVASSYLVSINATADTPDRAAAVANAYANATVTVRKIRFNAQLEPKLSRAQNALRELPNAGPEGAAAVPVREEAVRQISQLQSLLGAPDPSFQILSNAVAPEESTGPAATIIIGAAAVAGVILGLVLTMAYSASRVRRLENDGDLARAFDTPVISHIPLSRNPGSGALAPTLLRPSGWQSYGYLSEQLETLRTDRNSSRVIAFTGPGPGNGATTSALNTALQLAESGYSVLLVDTDLRHHSLSDVIAFAPVHGVRAALERQVSVRSAVIRWRKELHLDLLLVNVVEGASNSAMSKDNVRRLLSQANGSWDFIVVDVARPAQGRASNPFLATADDVVVAVRAGVTAMESLEELMELFAVDEVEPRGFVVVGGKRVRDVHKPPMPQQRNSSTVVESDAPVPENA